MLLEDFDARNPKTVPVSSKDDCANDKLQNTTRIEFLSATNGVPFAKTDVGNGAGSQFGVG